MNLLLIITIVILCVYIVFLRSNRNTNNIPESTNEPEPNTKYKHAIVYQGQNQGNTWSKYSKYKSLKSAEMAYNDLTKSNTSDWVFRIIPYFAGHWWQNPEDERKSYISVNKLLWKFIHDKGYDDECRTFINDAK